MWMANDLLEGTGQVVWASGHGYWPKSQCKIPKNIIQRKLSQGIQAACESKQGDFLLTGILHSY